MEYFLLDFDGQNKLGPLSYEELRRKIYSRMCQADTLARHDGMPEWKPVSEIVPELFRKRSLPPSSPSEGPQSETTGQLKTRQLNPSGSTGISPTAKAKPGGLLPLIICFLVVFILYGVSSVGPSSTRSSSATSELDVIGTHIAYSQNGNKKVAGAIRNNGTKSYRYVQVEINLYNNAGTQVGSTMANVNNLEPGKSWEFEALILQENASSFKVMHVTAF